MVAKAGSLEETTQRIPTKHRQEENMQTPHRKAAVRLQIQTLHLKPHLSKSTVKYYYQDVLKVSKIKVFILQKNVPCYEYIIILYMTLLDTHASMCKKHFTCCSWSMWSFNSNSLYAVT